ncbi:diguanylate cyclase domain-containing protein [Rugamonas aquatica]|nr:diguanylate cyclase [Rugamonas aquatica]
MTIPSSIGVAAWTPKAGESAEQLLRAADAALYRAKQLSRNRAELDA